MVLDSDCVRDVLMAIERCEFGETLTLEALCQQVGQRSREEVWYTCLKLEEGGFLRLTLVPQMRQVLPGIKSIDDLTYQGHEFIAKIRDAMDRCEKRHQGRSELFSFRDLVHCGRRYCRGDQRLSEAQSLSRCDTTYRLPFFRSASDGSGKSFSVRYHTSVRVLMYCISQPISETTATMSKNRVIIALLSYSRS